MTNRTKRIVFCVLILLTLITIRTLQLGYEKSEAADVQDEIEIDLDSEIENNFFKTNFDVYAFSFLQIMEYLKWKNENACQVYQDFGGVMDKTRKVCSYIYIQLCFQIKNGLVN